MKQLKEETAEENIQEYKEMDKISLNTNLH